jgi:hypothetical protein
MSSSAAASAARGRASASGRPVAVRLFSKKCTDAHAGNIGAAAQPRAGNRRRSRRRGAACRWPARGGGERQRGGAAAGRCGGWRWGRACRCQSRARHERLVCVARAAELVAAAPGGLRIRLARRRRRVSGGIRQHEPCVCSRPQRVARRCTRARRTFGASTVTDTASSALTILLHAPRQGPQLRCSLQRTRPATPAATRRARAASAACSPPRTAACQERGAAGGEFGERAPRGRSSRRTSYRTNKGSRRLPDGEVVNARRSGGTWRAACELQRATRNAAVPTRCVGNLSGWSLLGKTLDRTVVDSEALVSHLHTRAVPPRCPLRCPRRRAQSQSPPRPFPYPQPRPLASRPAALPSTAPPAGCSGPAPSPSPQPHRGCHAPPQKNEFVAVRPPLLRSRHSRRSCRRPAPVHRRGSAPRALPPVLSPRCEHISSTAYGFVLFSLRSCERRSLRRRTRLPVAPALDPSSVTPSPPAPPLRPPVTRHHTPKTHRTPATAPPPPCHLAPTPHAHSVQRAHTHVMTRHRDRKISTPRFKRGSPRARRCRRRPPRPARAQTPPARESIARHHSRSACVQKAL